MYATLYEGALDSFRYAYVIRDHLGNGRTYFSDINNSLDISIIGFNELIEENHYYPFGLEMDGPWITTTYGTSNPYTYNDKEWVENLQLNWFNYGARWHDPAAARWWAVDPSAESFYRWTPYSYTFDNPTRFMDPDGQVPSIANGPGDPPTPTVAGVLFEAFQNARAGLYNMGMRASELFSGGDGNTVTRMRVNYDEHGAIPIGEPVVIQQEAKKGALAEAGDMALDVLALTPVAELSATRGALSAPFLAARAPSSIIPSIAKQFKNFECVECADAIVSALKEKGISGQLLELVTPKATGMQANIWSDTAGKLISKSGKHQGVLVDGKVYDNIHTDGIDYNDWLDDIHSPGGYEIKTTDF